MDTVTTSPAVSGGAQQSEEQFLEKARQLRPFYFIVVVWGERYVDFLMNFCVPSLLSPNNIPALANRGKNKFLIATTDEDWARMQGRPIFELLKQYVEPVLIRIPPFPAGESACVHMGIGHKLATHMAFEARAYSAVLTPDMMVSDGTFAAAQRHAVNGIQVVLVAALRFAEEPLFENLEKLGLASASSRFGDEGRAFVATGRQFVKAGLSSFHSETLRYEWDKPYFAAFPSAVWWRVDDDGIIVHSMSWAPLLVDYDAVEHHDSWALDNWTIDGDYVYRNFGVDGKIHVVRDSDEVMLVSWAPLEDRIQELNPTFPSYLHPVWGEWIKGAVFYEAMSNPIFDPLKRAIFPLPVYWHAGEIDRKKWLAVEFKAISVIGKYGSIPIPAEVRKSLVANGTPLGLVGVKSLWTRLVFAAGELRVAAVKLVYFSARYAFRLSRFVYHYWEDRHRLLGVAKRALSGDSEARMRMKKSARYLIRMITGV